MTARYSKPLPIKCDECGDVYLCRDYGYNTVHYHPIDRAQLKAELVEAGWRIEGEHERHICPECTQGRD